MNFDSEEGKTPTDAIEVGKSSDIEFLSLPQNSHENRAENANDSTTTFKQSILNSSVAIEAEEKELNSLGKMESTIFQPAEVINTTDKVIHEESLKYKKNEFYLQKEDSSRSGTNQETETNKIYQRFLFNTRRQNAEETFENFATSLKILSNSCHYDADETLINSLIRDRFIAGIREAQIQAEILQPKHQGSKFVENKEIESSENKYYDLSLEKTIKLATLLEKYRKAANRLKVEYESDSEDAQGSSLCEDKKRYVTIPSIVQGESTDTIETMMEVGNANNGNTDASGVIWNPKEEPKNDRNETELSSVIKSTSKLKCAKRHNNKLKNMKKAAPIYNCNYCTDCFSNKKFLAKHLKQFHANEERVTCDECGREFDDQVKLQKHSDTAHKKKAIICQLCMNSYKSQACLKAHVRGKHETGGEKVCLICFQVMADDKELKVVRIFSIKNILIC